MSPAEIPGRPIRLPNHPELLREQLLDSFNLEELQTLYFDLGIDFDELQGHTKKAKIISFIEYLSRRGRLQELINVLQQVRPNIAWPTLKTELLPEEAPFKGLRYFDEKDASLFFGRQTLVEKIVDRIPKSNFLAIVGASGSGKSSIVRAGLIPSLIQKGNWSIFTLTPTDHPLTSLASALTRNVESITATATLIDDMTRESRSLELYLRRLFEQPISSETYSINPSYQNYLATLRNKLVSRFEIIELQEVCVRLQISYDNLPGTTLEGKNRELLNYLDRRNRLNDLIQLVTELRPNLDWGIPPERNIISITELQKETTQQSRILLVIDQFEELFYLCRDEKERIAFIDNLLNVSKQYSFAKIVIVLRADFYAYAGNYEGLRQALEQNQIFVGAMSQKELRVVIEGSARSAGLTYQKGLVEVILDDIGEEPGMLPLLSHALMETWLRREGQVMTLAGYQEAGGIRGAIAISAENVYLTLSPEEQRTARDIFLRLTELGEGTTDTRRRINKNDLLRRTVEESTPTRISWGTRKPFEQLENDTMDAAIVANVLTTLVNARLIVVDLDNVEIAHEALIRGWPRLRQWLDEDRENLTIHRQLTQAAQAWMNSGQDYSYLYQGYRLAQMEEWAKANPDQLSHIEKQFILASIQAKKSRFQHSLTGAWSGCIFLLSRIGYVIAITILGFVLVGVIFSSANRTVQILSIVAVALLVVAYPVKRNWGRIYAPIQKWSAIRSNYHHITEQWNMCTPLQKLVLLHAPEHRSFSVADLESGFRILGAGSGAGSIQLALSSLTKQKLAVEEGGKWRIAHPKALSQHRQKHQEELNLLVSQLREESPFFKRAFLFLQHVGLVLTEIPGKPVYLCHAAENLSPQIKHHLLFPVCLSFFIGTEINDEDIRKIRKWAKEVDENTNSVLLLTNCRLNNSAWAQIGTLRLSSFHILPIDYVAIDEGLAKKRESQTLAAEVEKWLGRNFDPYDVRAPVAGAFSFFGRESYIIQFLRDLENGYSFGVFGLRKMGKTSLLQTLRDRAPYPVALVNAQTVSSRGLTALYQRSFEYWSQWIKVHYHKEWQPPEIARNESPGAFASKIIGLFDWLKREGLDARLGLFLDEAELIVPEPEETGEKLQLYLGLVRALRGLIDEDHPLTLVVASLNPSITRINNWGREQNPTYSLFKENNLPPLTKDDCIQMVRNIGLQVGLVYDEDSLQAISDLSGGHPFLARQLCSVLFSLRDRELGQIKRDEIDGAANHFIYSDQTVSYLDAGIWQDAGNAHLWSSPEQAEENQNVLLELAKADGLLSTEDLLSPNPAVRRESIIGLTNYGIIHDPEPGLYAIKFGLLRQWLRHRKLGLG